MATKATLGEDIRIKSSSLLNKLPLVFLLLGLGCIIFWSTLLGADRSRAMISYLFGFSVILSLALGCLGFVIIQHLTRAGWSVVVRRIAETAGALFPLFIILFLPIVIFSHDIYSWLDAHHIDSILEKKLPYLNYSFFLARSFSYLLIWALMGVWFYNTSVAQDLGARFNLTKSMQALSAPGILIFAGTLTFASFDWFMSLQPHWYSTIFGVYFFAGCILSAFAFITLVALVLQSSGSLSQAITGEHYHDLGKLMFGFTVFWAYISFSQFFIYWYGNIPEEVEFYTHRLHHGWENISWALPVLHFFIPFFLLMSRVLKRVKFILAFNALFLLCVHIIDLYWLIIPTYLDSHGASYFQITLSDVLALLGLIFIFVGSYLFLLTRRALVPTGDPRLKESLVFENF